MILKIKKYINHLWPELSTAKSLEEPIKTSWILASGVGGLHILSVGVGLSGSWTAIDGMLFIGIAVSIYLKSRLLLTSGAAFFLLEKGLVWTGGNPRGFVLGLLLIAYLSTALRLIYGYRRLQKKRPSSNQDSRSETKLAS